mmetsp:Transcript_1323/g.5099  ORF Transcript_1323/g.5099 Transcript_1323/m.5099 type:complete len:126 (-) Transcript_1323:159-536(-)
MARKPGLLIAGILGLLAGGTLFGLGLRRGIREAKRKPKHPRATDTRKQPRPHRSSFEHADGQKKTSDARGVTRPNNRAKMNLTAGGDSVSTTASRSFNATTRRPYAPPPRRRSGRGGRMPDRCAD